MAAQSERARWNVPEYPLLHPVPLFALVMLIVNDHVLKQRYPGWITGKLSDVAGMVFFPLFLLAVIDIGARLWGSVRLQRDRVLMICALVTVIVFCAVKTWAPATDLYELGLGLLQWPFRAGFAILTGESTGALARVALVRDATDLLAVPFVAIAILVGRPFTPSTQAARQT